MESIEGLNVILLGANIVVGFFIIQEVWKLQREKRRLLEEESC